MSAAGQPTPMEAMAEAPETAAQLRRLAGGPIDTTHTGWATERLRLAGVPTSTYRTRAVGPTGSGSRLRDAALVQFFAAGLDSQPWYTAFLGGSITERLDTKGHDLEAAHTSVGRFSITGKIERTYHQTQTLSGNDEQGYVITLRSVTPSSIAPPLDSSKTALTMVPSGEVLTVDADGRLVWDHVVTAAGAALLPGKLDGWVTEATRRLGVDKAERATYEAEATDWVALLTNAEAWRAVVDAAGTLDGNSAWRPRW